MTIKLFILVCLLSIEGPWLLLRVLLGVSPIYFWDWVVVGDQTLEKKLIYFE